MPGRKKDKAKVGDNAQATPDQLRTARLIQTKTEDPSLKEKIKQVMDATKKTADEAFTALHDCDNDPNRAVNMLLEGIQSVWSEKKKKVRSIGEKNSKDAKLSPNESTVPADDATDTVEGKSSGAQVFRTRGERGRGEKGRVRGRECFDKSVVNTSFSTSNRGRRNVTEFGSARGGKFGGRGFERGKPQFNQILDDWKKTQYDDWDCEEYTGSLADTKVFTSSFVNRVNCVEHEDLTPKVSSLTITPSKHNTESFSTSSPKPLSDPTTQQPTENLNPTITQTDINSEVTKKENYWPTPFGAKPKSDAVLHPMAIQIRPRPETALKVSPFKISRAAVEMPPEVANDAPVDLQFGSLELGQWALQNSGSIKIEKKPAQETIVSKSTSNSESSNGNSKGADSRTESQEAVFQDSKCSSSTQLPSQTSGASSESQSFAPNNFVACGSHSFPQFQVPTRAYPPMFQGNIESVQYSGNTTAGGGDGSVEMSSTSYSYSSQQSNHSSSKDFPEVPTTSEEAPAFPVAQVSNKHLGVAASGGPYVGQGGVQYLQNPVFYDDLQVLPTRIHHPASFYDVTYQPSRDGVQYSLADVRTENGSQGGAIPPSSVNHPPQFVNPPFPQNFPFFYGGSVVQGNFQYGPGYHPFPPYGPSGTPAGIFNKGYSGFGNYTEGFDHGGDYKAGTSQLKPVQQLNSGLPVSPDVQNVYSRSKQYKQSFHSSGAPLGSQTPIASSSYAQPLFIPSMPPYNTPPLRHPLPQDVPSSSKGRSQSGSPPS